MVVEPGMKHSWYIFKVVTEIPISNQLRRDYDSCYDKVVRWQSYESEYPI